MGIKNIYCKLVLKYLFSLYRQFIIAQARKKNLNIYNISSNFTLLKFLRVLYDTKKRNIFIKKTYKKRLNKKYFKKK